MYLKSSMNNILNTNNWI